MSYITIPYDLYESSKEFVIIMPLGGVKKDSLSLEIKKYQLFITGYRQKIELRDDFVPVEENCYRGEIKTVIDLPPSVYFKDIQTRLTPENVLVIIIPKNIEPESIKIQIEYEEGMSR